MIENERTETSTLIKEAPEAASPRGRGRPRDGEAKARILEAALELLDDTAFTEITTDALAERAGASKATIYRWWPTKAAVLLEALREAVGQELPFPQTGELREDVRLQLRNFVKLLTGPRGRMFKAFFVAAQNDPEVADAFERVWRQPRRASVRAGLESHRGNQMRGDADLELVIDAMYGPLYYRAFFGHQGLCEGYADKVADVVLRGILRN